MKGKQRINRLLRALFCLALALSLTAVDVAPAAALVSQADIDALKGDAGDLKNKRKELESKLDKLAKDKSTAMQRKALLDDQISNTSAQIDNVERQIENYNLLIQQQEEALADAEKREEAQYALFCKRVRAMEEQGTVSYWSVLFKADSFTDLLSRLDFVGEVMDYDERVMQDLRDLQTEIAEAKAALEASRAESEEAKADLETKKKELDAQRKEANRVIQELTDAENETEAVLDETEEEADRIQEEIQRLSRELAAQQAAQGNAGVSNPGGYIWPVNSRYITSTVGGRSSPGGIGSTNHRGTDIGRVGFTSSIYAAKDGTVIKSERSGSYGEYVVIAHSGSGNTTLYAHMSKRIAQVGQHVKQGDVIGITGSTGNSTRPHLHFEVVENGSRVNPLSHGAEPKKGYLSGYTLAGDAVGH